MNVVGTIDDVMRTDLTVLAQPLSDSDLISNPADSAVKQEPARKAAAPMSLQALVTAITDLPAIELSPELRCLATAVYFESRGEPLEGQLAVAQVIRNRTVAGDWPHKICGVVYQPKQFSFTSDSHPDQPSRQSLWRIAQAIALIAATDNWADLVQNATHFHATRVSPRWANLRKVSTIGNHVFYQ